MQFCQISCNAVKSSATEWTDRRTTGEIIVTNYKPDHYTGLNGITLQ